MQTRKPLYLVDASIYIFRAYFSMPDSIKGSSGQPLNAVYGFANFLLGLHEKSQGQYYAITFDESLDQSFRNEIYPAYKANRERPPDELKHQFKLCKKLAQALGFATFSSNRDEADDLIGTIARKLRPKNFRMVYVTSDKDIAQLMQSTDIFWNYAKDDKLKVRDIKSKYGVHARQLRDWLALAGDSVDNIPGIPGIGNKTAASLLDKFNSLDGIYKKLHKVPDSGLRGSKRIHSLLTAHKEMAYLSQELATINSKAKINCPVAGLRKKPTRARDIHNFCDEIGTGNNLRNRLLKTK